jgi:predicted lipoprotein
MFGLKSMVVQAAEAAVREEAAQKAVSGVSVAVAQSWAQKATALSGSFHSRCC